MSIVKLNNNGVKNASAFGSVSASSLGSMVLIKKLTASSSATLSFVDGSSSVVLDNTYKEYLFTFNNIHPATSGANLEFQGNASGGSGFNETITSTNFNPYHLESGSEHILRYMTAQDQAQGTSYQRISEDVNNDNDGCLAGHLYLYNPSSTTFVKHFMSQTQIMSSGNGSYGTFCAGYFNTTSAIDEISFKFHSGNIDAGDICLYGIN
mgnify:CR=1 FL=1|tara:strand:- start:13 stop:639 length:627 start_codon:yes stop_codon:yes gene_type:complete